MSRKKIIRKTLLAKRENLTHEQVRTWSQTIQDALLSTKEFQKAQHIAAYDPIRNEVDTQAIIEAGWASHKQIYLPRWEPSTATIRFYPVHDWSELERRPWGTREPPQLEGSEAQALDMILVPAVAFDRHGYRLGYGFGGYDRALERFPCHHWGLAYEFQIIDKLPVELHDAPCHCILTEAGRVMAP